MLTLAAIEEGVRERLLDDEDTKEVGVVILGAGASGSRPDCRGIPAAPSP